MTVDFPMTDNYERPLDADQFGTSPDVAQGDGYMDSHCIEMHGLPEDATVEYGEAQITGEHADRIDVAGYIQQVPEGDGWDADIDPVAAAEPYADAGGGWTYETDASHGQVVVVLQLDAPADERLEPGGSNSTDPPKNDSNNSQQGAKHAVRRGRRRRRDARIRRVVVVALSVAALARHRG